jgi:NADH dehydrogenase (ubiquinone) Fe-S protein 3
MLKLHSLTRVSTAIDITVIDNISQELRFNLSYHLLSITTNTRCSISTRASESKPILSLQSLYPAFNWAERETWDMYGVFFVKHPDLRRILTDYGFTGFPLRKDFPLSGYREVQFEDSIKHVEYSLTELTQSYRLLSFSNT